MDVHVTATVGPGEQFGGWTIVQLPSVHDEMPSSCHEQSGKG